MQKLTYNIKQYEATPTKTGGYILTNESEKLLLHKSVLKTKGGSIKYAPYCLKDIEQNKHLTGVFVDFKTTTTDIPTFYYADEEYKYNIKVDAEHNKAYIEKVKNPLKH